jgi:hypothetical protein
VTADGHCEQGRQRYGRDQTFHVTSIQPGHHLPGFHCSGFYRDAILGVSGASVKKKMPGGAARTSCSNQGTSSSVALP